MAFLLCYHRTRGVLTPVKSVRSASYNRHPPTNINRSQGGRKVPSIKTSRRVLRGTAATAPPFTPYPQRQDRLREVLLQQPQHSTIGSTHHGDHTAQTIQAQSHTQLEEGRKSQLDGSAGFPPSPEREDDLGMGSLKPRTTARVVSSKVTECFAGTRQQLLHDIETWRTTGSVPIFILDGIAGIGKSTIVKTRPITPTLREHISEVLKAQPDILQKAIRMQFDALVHEPLRGVFENQRETHTISIDAIDECNLTEAVELLSILLNSIPQHSGLRLLVTCRPERPFRLLLQQYQGPRVFHLHEIENSVVQADIRLYINHCLSPAQIDKALPDLLPPRWRASPNEIEALVQMAGKLFIVASTAISFILDPLRLAPAKQMAQLLDAKSGATLAGEPNGPPTNRDVVIDSRFFIEASARHFHLAQHCLRIMVKMLKENVCELPRSDWDIESSNLPPGTKDCIPPELAYACAYWVLHLQEGLAHLIGRHDVIDQLRIFVEQHLLSWLEVLAWTNRFDTAWGDISLLSESIKRLLPVAGEGTLANLEHVASVLRDLLRFISLHPELPRRLPMHIYLSVLPFVPSQSKIRHLYAKSASNTTRSIAVVSGLEQNWDPNLCHLPRNTEGDGFVPLWHNDCPLARAVFCLYNAKSGQLLQSLGPEMSMEDTWYASVAFSSDSRYIASTTSFGCPNLGRGFWGIGWELLFPWFTSPR
ncbi:hypothetical protein BKA70DRAFT_1464328 [Coprinopsis sp. MPI-PUGE-AT-0042]|nr:hypothetical protein BKA70DRAFT_1464328 [Coprinopsis sp. MPI-PUGE-AT-0042]